MNWKVENIKRQTGTGLVVEVAYRVVAKQSGLIADHRGKVILTGDPSATGFVPFEQLTEGQVIQWVKASVDVSTIEAGVQATLDAKVQKVEQKEVVSGLPWSNRLRPIMA
jgi:hypothetical protein